MQQEPGTDAQRLRETIFAELKRRAGWVAAGGYAGCSFAPSSPVPSSAAARLFVDRLTQLGAAFWLIPTSWEAMLTFVVSPPPRQAAHPIQPPPAADNGPASASSSRAAVPASSDAPDQAPNR